jgi:exosortase D (VPLPA-CTERM-specific)
MNDIFKYLKMIKPAGWLKGISFALVIAATYYTALKRLVLHDWAMEDYSHCYLIPFVFLYLLWEKRRELAITPSAASWLGFIPFVFGILMFWLGELSGELFSLYISMWLVVVSLLWMNLGWRKIKIMAFPLFILLTMFPFPNFINNRILLNLKIVSTQIGVALLQLYGMSAYREGNIIDLGFTQLQVVDACSGLRYVIPLLVLSLLLAYWFKAAMWKRIVLVLSSIPLSVMVNSMRIAITGILYSSWGAQVAEGFFHGFSGWLIFMLTIPVLLAEMWLLKKIGKRDYEREEDFKLAADSFPPAEKANNWKSLLQPMYLAGISIIAATLVISHTVEFREKIPVNKSFTQFPLKIGEWQGTSQTMDKEFIDLLHFTDYIMVNYRNGKGQDVEFYVAYYESQSKARATHSPETCLPGGGWTFEQSGIAKFALNNGQMLQTNRAFIGKSGVKQLTYFWFPQRGRVLTSLTQVKLYSFWDALTRQRTDGALVRIITPLYPHEDIKEAESRLQGFTKQVVPVLNEFLPR